MLEKIGTTEDLKTMETKEKKELAQEIRNLIIQTVSETGGHLASNLGVVELTIAIHTVFSVPKDKMIWDVGHQTYVHKILTGRKDQMKTLRQLDGVAGFPKVSESEYDCFNTGHSSTSISVALGMARARDILKENNHVIAIIGDGALTGGMALEALNDAGNSGTNIIVILNDNEMSISKNVGGMNTFLSKLRTKKLYTQTNTTIKKILYKVPFVGEKTVKIAQKLKRGIKQLFIQKMFFEDIGFTYLGPVDGHNLERLESILKVAKTIKGPVLVHVRTKKGKGYKPAEENPDKFHSISSFDIKTGKKTKSGTKDYSKVFGDKLVKMAKKDNRIVAITAAMKEGTGLLEFASRYPTRFFDVGIAEQHALGLAAGFAKAGLKPVVPIYSSFLQRGYDQILHDICIQNLPVTICVDRAGIVGNDGETHQGIYDLSFLNTIPNLNIAAPKDFMELENMLKFAMQIEKPLAIRYPRGGEGNIEFQKHMPIELGKAEIIQEGTDISIFAIGKMVSTAKEVADILLKEENIEAEVINIRFLKPIDEETIIKSIRKTKNAITIEDNEITGGLGETISFLISQEGENYPITHFAYPDAFIKHGTVKEIEEIYGLDAKSIAEKIILQNDKHRMIV